MTTRRCTALIADDEPLLRSSLARMLADAWPELFLQHRQDVVADPGPCVRRVGVVGVLPELDPLGTACGNGVVPAQTEEGAAVTTYDSGHPRQGSRTGATSASCAAP